MLRDRFRCQKNNKMVRMKRRLLVISALLLMGSPTSYGLPLTMTDYSQLNHDEPTHWTKAATTPTRQDEWKSERTSEASDPLTTNTPTSTREVELETFSTSWTRINPSTDASSSRPSSPPTSEATSPSTNPPTNPTENFQTQSPTINPSSSSPTIMASRATETPKIRPTLNRKMSFSSPVTFSSTSRASKARASARPILPSTVSSLRSTENPINDTKFEHADITSEVASIETKDTLADLHQEATTRNLQENITEQFYRYDIIEDIRNLFSSDTDENEIKENQLEDVLGFKNDEKIPTEETLIVQKLDEGGYENYQEEDENRRDEGKKLYDALVVPTLGEREPVANYETPFSDWDRESEEQEHALENIVFQASNESEVANMDVQKGSLQAGSWFLLLLAGNSTIVQMRQKDFAKYLKLNLAARLSLEYDELRVNKVVLAPPRLMVNVSVVPSENDNFDEEFDLNERLFGEEEAPLHKLAETNATLLELSGEEYHVVRFLSLRSAQPVTMEEAVSEASTFTSDKHGDIEYLIYIIVGGPCITVIIFLIYTLYRLYILPKRMEWPWNREKPSAVRHHRMEEAPVGPLRVIYSGSFADRKGPPTGSWLDEQYRPEQPPAVENPNYGLGSLSKTALSEICDPSVLDSPRFNVRMMGCQPGHLLLPRTPVKKVQTELRPPKLVKGLDNPNYMT